MNMIQKWNVKRMDVYGDWLNYLWCLSNIGASEGDRLKYFNLGVEMSKKSPKFKGEDDVKKNWGAKDGYSIGTLKMWARNDNLIEYKQLVYNKEVKLTDPLLNEYINLLKQGEVGCGHFTPTRRIPFTTCFTGLRMR